MESSTATRPWGDDDSPPLSTTECSPLTRSRTEIPPPSARLDQNNALSAKHKLPRIQCS